MGSEKVYGELQISENGKEVQNVWDIKSLVLVRAKVLLLVAMSLLNSSERIFLMRL